MTSKLGFGFLRLPKRGGDFDWDTVCCMVDQFMAGGGTFFDTCYTYLNGMSEYGIIRDTPLANIDMDAVLQELLIFATIWARKVCQLIPYYLLEL